jgi:hypothetical protein
MSPRIAGFLADVSWFSRWGSYSTMAWPDVDFDNAIIRYILRRSAVACIARKTAVDGRILNAGPLRPCDEVGMPCDEVLVRPCDEVGKVRVAGCALPCVCVIIPDYCTAWTLPRKGHVHVACIIYSVEFRDIMKRTYDADFMHVPSTRYI